MKKVSIFLFAALLFCSLPQFSYATTPKSGTVCTKLNQSQIVGNTRYTCIKSGKRLVWDKGTKIKVSSATSNPNGSAQTSSPATQTPSSSSQATLPQEGSPCRKIGEKLNGTNGYMRCVWTGHADTVEEAMQNMRWHFYPILTLSTSKSNSYQTTPLENATCTNSGDTFDVKNGYLECRWTAKYTLKWVMIHSVKDAFDNANSPVPIDDCKLRNADSHADRTGRNSGSGLEGFPLTETNKNGMNAFGSNEVLIVPVDFPDFPGGKDVTSELEFDKKWLTSWFDYFSNGNSKFNVTTINSWLRMPKNRSEYPTDGKTTNALNTGNQVMGSQAQAFIDEISKIVDLRKFSTVYVFYPDGEYVNNDLIVRNFSFNIGNGAKNLNFFSWGRNLEGMETMKWTFYVHETMHDFNIVGHAPGNGWPLGMMTNQSGISEAINPWEQFLLGWLPVSQIYCDDINGLKSKRISLTPMEREDKQTKMAIIKLSPTRAIVVESHGIDKWSNFQYGDRRFPPGFYSIMAYVVDLDKTVAPPVRSDGSSLSNDDWAWGVWQKVDGGASNRFNVNVGDRKNLADYVAVLGDSFTIEGVRIRFVETGDYETIEISRA